MTTTAANAKGSTGNSQTTPLTPNSSCTATGSGDTKNSTTVQFIWNLGGNPDGLTCWEAVVDVMQWDYMLDNDRYCGNDFQGPLYQQGFNIRLFANQNAPGYHVVLTGVIVDDGETCPFVNKLIYQSN